MMNHIRKMGFHPLVWGLPLLAILESCTPQISAISGAIVQAPSGTSFTCSASATPVPSKLLRLTVPQYKNTVYALTTQGLSSADVTAFTSYYATLTGSISFPTEGSYGLGNAMVYDTADQTESYSLATGQYTLASSVAAWIIANQTRLSLFVNTFAGSGICASSLTNTGVAKTCYDAFIKGFGLYALRRPVQTANNTIDASSSNAAAANDLTFYEGVYTDTGNGGFDALITAMLLAPDTVFLTQFSGSVASSTSTTEQLALTNYEIAAKMAYYYTDSPPDASLMAAAKAGFTGTGNTIDEQSNRLFATKNARARFTDFFTQWIRPTAVPALASSINAPSTDLVALRNNAIQEMVDLTTYYTFGTTTGKASDIITSNISFAKTSDLADLYGVSTWQGPNSDGTYDATKLVRFSSGSPRAGLFTRAGYAFSGARDTNPILRGSRIWKNYFCQNLSPPAAFTLSDHVLISGPPTVRNVVAANTEIPGSSCAACHSKIINPLGFGLENYDAFGRYHTQEALYDSTSGAVASYVATNAQSQPLVAFRNPAESYDPVTFSKLVGTSTAFNSCFVRHYFRFSQARNEQDSPDGCQMSQMLDSLTGANGSGSLQNMIKSVPTTSYFKTRSITP